MRRLEAQIANSNLTGRISLSKIQLNDKTPLILLNNGQKPIMLT